MSLYSPGWLIYSHSNQQSNLAGFLLFEETDANAAELIRFQRQAGKSQCQHQKEWKKLFSTLKCQGSDCFHHSRFIFLDFIMWASSNIQNTATSTADGFIVQWTYSKLGLIREAVHRYSPLISVFYISKYPWTEMKWKPSPRFIRRFHITKPRKGSFSFIFSKAAKTVLMFHFTTLILIAVFDGHFQFLC